MIYISRLTKFLLFQETLKKHLVEHAVSQAPVSRIKFLPNIPILEKKNYTSWEQRMRAALILNNTWIDENEEIITAEQKEKSEIAVQTVIMYLDDNNDSLITSDNVEDIHQV